MATSATAERSDTAAGLLEELAAGASVDEVFRRLYELYYRSVCHFFARRGFSTDDSLDLTQETFLSIYKGIGAFRGQAQFETWLFKIATNNYRERLRRGSAGKRSGEEVPLSGDGSGGELGAEPASSSPRPGDELLARERSRLLRQAIGQMPEQMRRCFILRVYHEMKYREISVLLRLSIETVKAHLFQARQRLRRELGDYFDEGAEGARETATWMS